MQFTKLEMYDFLADCVGIGQDTMDVLIKVMGDTPETYKRILHKMTNYKSFAELVESRQIVD